jgi:hypothetical protein
VKRTVHDMVSRGTASFKEVFGEAAHRTNAQAVKETLQARFVSLYFLRLFIFACLQKRL